MNEIELLKQRITDLETQLKNFLTARTIPFEFQRSLESIGYPKLNIRSITENDGTFPNPSKSVTQGAGTTNVLDLPTFWAQIESNRSGPTKWIPVYIKSEFL